MSSHGDTKLEVTHSIASFGSATSHHKRGVDLVSVSADQAYVAAFSKADGMISWWRVNYPSHPSPSNVDPVLEFEGSMISDNYREVAKSQSEGRPYHILGECLAII